VVTVRHGWRLPAAKRDYNGDNAAGSTAPVILRLGVPVNLTSWAGVRPGGVRCHAPIQAGCLSVYLSYLEWELLP
jgi:hypothetical protein